MSQKARKSDKFIKIHLTKKNVVPLVSRRNIEPELWTILEYHSEVNNGWKELVKQRGLSKSTHNTQVFLRFQAFIRQAKSYYFAAKELHYRSSGLMYYYSFLNLAKALVCLHEPKSVKGFISHGVSYPWVDVNRDFALDTLVTKPSGVFPLFYKAVTGVDIKNKTSFNVKNLLSYCTDISYQYESGGFGTSKVIPGQSAILMDSKQKTSWAMLAIPRFSEMKVYKKLLNTLLSEYEVVEVGNAMAERVFNLMALPKSGHTFLQGKKSTPWISSNISDSLTIRDMTVDLLKPFLSPRYFFDDNNYQLELPNRVNNQQAVGETVSIYLLMYYVSSLVRYKPQYLEKLLDSKPSWLIESFVQSCPTTFLRAIVSQIANKVYVIQTQ